MIVVLSLFMTFALSVAPVFAETSSPAAGDEERARQETKGLHKEYYFLVLDGKGMPVKRVLINGQDVLGGSVISLSMPINVTPEIRLGLNELAVQLVSHNQEGLVTVMEKRVNGPKKTEMVRLELKPNESQGKEMVKKLAFSIDPAPQTPVRIELSKEDEKNILSTVEKYYSALDSKSGSKLRSLYGPALKVEKSIFPEGADFFTRVLNKEIVLLSRREIKMMPFRIDDVMLEQDGDKIKALRKDRKPMMESNEIEVKQTPIISVLTEDKARGGKKIKLSRSQEDKLDEPDEPEQIEPSDEPQKKPDKKAVKPVYSAKQRLVTTTLSFRRLNGKWCLALPRGL